MPCSLVMTLRPAFTADTDGLADGGGMTMSRLLVRRSRGVTGRAAPTDEAPLAGAGAFGRGLVVIEGWGAGAFGRGLVVAEVPGAGAFGRGLVVAKDLGAGGFGRGLVVEIAPSSGLSPNLS